MDKTHAHRSYRAHDQFFILSQQSLVNYQPIFKRSIFVITIEETILHLVGGWQCPLRCWEWSWGILQKLKANSEPCCSLVQFWVRGAEENVRKCPETCSMWCSFRHHKGHPWAGSAARAFVPNFRIPDVVLYTTSVMFVDRYMATNLCSSSCCCSCTATVQFWPSKQVYLPRAKSALSPWLFYPWVVLGQTLFFWLICTLFVS